MIVGLGIDVIENRRVEQELAQGEWAQEDGIFSGAEIRQCNTGKKPARRYAAMLCGKGSRPESAGRSIWRFKGDSD